MSTAQDMSGRGHHSRWAEEVEQEEAQGPPEAAIYDEVSGQYWNSNASWFDGMEVERGKSRHRLDLSHGFMRNIVRTPPGSLPALGLPVKEPGTPHGMLSARLLRAQVANQRDRDAYEQSWKEAYKAAGPFQQRWGVGVVVPDESRSRSSP